MSNTTTFLSICTIVPLNASHSNPSWCCHNEGHDPFIKCVMFEGLGKEIRLIEKFAIDLDLIFAATETPGTDRRNHELRS
jgi:hypothetical protein